jgi:hypothetical protein
MNDKQLQRFLSKVDKTDHQRCKAHGCWMWTSSTKGAGYGNFRLNGKFVSAHRTSYEHYIGEIPEGLVVRHQCPYVEGETDNRRCVNPDHLDVGTSKQNTIEGTGLAAKNASKNHCPKCESDYTAMKNGKRFCRPCSISYQREWKSRKAAL